MYLGPLATAHVPGKEGERGADPPSTPGHQTDSVVSAWPVSFSAGVTTEANSNYTGELSHYCDFHPLIRFRC